MTLFTPCKGKTACRDDGRQCLVCGRSFEEIARTRELIDALADFACAQDYDNVETFAAYIATKLEKKIKRRRACGTEKPPHASTGHAAPAGFSLPGVTLHN